MDITHADKYTDATHSFGICWLRIDGLDAQGRTQGHDGSIHRSNLTRQEAIDWMAQAVEIGFREDALRIVATPQSDLDSEGLWELAETGLRAEFSPTEGRDKPFYI